MRCAVCGSTDVRPHLRVAGEAGSEGLIPTTDRFGTALSDIVRCGTCGHMQLAIAPSSAELNEAYAEAASDDYLNEEAGQRATARTILDRIEAHRSGGALLDLGCWVGFLLHESEGRGWRATGVEPSEFASAYARDRLGLDVHTAELFAVEFGAGAFDAVVMADVIEHLPEPGAALARARSLLGPGGVLALTLPDAGSWLARLLGRRWWSVIPTHVHYFTRSSIARLLESTGFDVVAIETAPKAFTVRYYLGRVGGYSRRAARALNRIASAAGIADRLWAPDFRDRMLVIARTEHRGESDQQPPATQATADRRVDLDHVV